MVEKNRKQLNQRRKKQGKGEISEPDHELYLGRSQLLPLLLLAVAAVFAYSMISTGSTDGLFWVTFVMYILLSLYFYFLKRPYLKLSNNEIATRKWGRERRVKWSQVEKITAQSGHVVISITDERNDWFFSRMLNRFKTDEMAAYLEKMAVKHQIPFENKGYR